MIKKTGYPSIFKTITPGGVLLSGAKPSCIVLISFEPNHTIKSNAHGFHIFKQI
jgi:hypothetical protein